MKAPIKLLMLTGVLFAATCNESFAYKDPDKNWSDMTKWAASVSKEQFGKVNHGRICQPELQTCSEVLIYLNKEHRKVMLRETVDSNDVVRKRDVCYFNQNEDIRNCLDWDTGARSRHMMDSNSNWREVDTK